MAAPALRVVDSMDQPSASEIEKFFVETETVTRNFEAWCANPATAGVDALHMAAYRAKVRIFLAQCEYVRHAIPLVELGIDDAARAEARLAGLVDRLEEMDDSFGWASQAPGAIKRLSREEAGA